MENCWDTTARSLSRTKRRSGFPRGHRFRFFYTGPCTYGIAICADVANRDVFSEAASQGARLIFEVAAPGLYGEQENRNWRSGYIWWSGECEKHLSQYARDYGIWIAVATQAGRTVDEDFPGGGFVFAPSGERVYATADWSESAAFLSIDFESTSIARLEY